MDWSPSGSTATECGASDADGTEVEHGVWAVWGSVTRMEQRRLSLCEDAEDVAGDASVLVLEFSECPVN